MTGEVKRISLINNNNTVNSVNGYESIGGLSSQTSKGTSLVRTVSTVRTDRAKPLTFNGESRSLFEHCWGKSSSVKSIANLRRLLTAVEEESTVDT